MTFLHYSTLAFTLLGGIALSKLVGTRSWPLYAAAATLLAADISYSVLVVYFDADPFALDAVFAAATLLWAAAALHPSMTADTGVVRGRSTPQSVARLCAPAACSLLGPVLLLTP